MADSRDLYAVLGVARSASADEIRSAYRKLARQHHPDRNPGNAQSEQRFKEVGAAYEVLSDPDKRKLYDEFGADALRSGFDPEQARAYRSWSQRSHGPPAGAEPFDPGAFGFDLSDIFGGGLGGSGFGGGGFGAPARPGPTRGADLRGVVELELAQAIRGTEVSLEVPTTEPCGTCHGSGDQPGSTPEQCADCGGTGQQQVARGPMRVVRTCATCLGEGKRRTLCPSCRGSGQHHTSRRVTVRIPPGADDGSTLRIAGKGAPGDRGGPPGDLVIETRVRPHPRFRREGLDLHTKLPVTLDEAYSGAHVDVETFEGKVKLRIPRGSQPGARLRLKGKGVARGPKRGDLYVELDVRLPDLHDEQLAQAFRKASSAYRRPPRQEMSA